MVNVWKIKVIFAGAAVVLSTALAGGCSGSLPYSKDWQYLKGPGNLPGVVGVMDSPIRDVSVPIGFVPILDESDAQLLPGNIRAIKHVYQGRATVNDIVDFYRRSLPIESWKFVNEGTRSDEYFLHYAKRNEKLFITARKRGVVLTLTINIGPAQPIRGASGPIPNVAYGATD